MRDLEKKILDILSEEPATPDEVAKRLGVAWATAQGRLLKLVGEGKILFTRKGKVNIYYTGGPRRLRFNAPSWVSAKPLEELAEELYKYFPEEVSAAEIVERERRKV